MSRIPASPPHADVGSIRPDPAALPNHRTRALLVPILLLALALRFWGLTFGLPYVLQPDEASVIDRTMRMWLTFDLNPHYLTYPSLFYYLQAAWQATIGHLGGIVHPALLSNPPTLLPFYYGISRALTALLGTATVLVTYFLGSRLSTRIGLISALFLSVAAIHVQQSHYITVDAATALFTAAAAAFAIAMLTVDGRAFQIMLVASAASAGLAAGTKYNAAMAIAMPLAALALAGDRPIRRRLAEALGALGVCVLAFLITTPYVLLDPALFRASLHSVFQHYTGGHAGAQGNDNIVWYLSDLVTRGIGLPMTVCALLGVPLIAARIGKQAIVLLVFVIPYYALLCSTVVRFDRNLLPILPFLALLAACASDTTVVGIRRVLRREFVGLALVLVVVAGPSLYLAAYGDQLSDYALAHRFTEQVAADWATAHLPDHAEVATENWEGRVFDSSPRQFSIHWASSLGNVPFLSLVRHRVRFVITDSYTDGEYEDDPLHFPVQAARYRELRRRAKVIGIIRGDGQERPGPVMTIYRMP